MLSGSMASGLLMVLICLIYCSTSCPATPWCRLLRPMTPNWKMIDGQWFFAATTMPAGAPQIKDCTGFRGQYVPKTGDVRVVVTQSKVIGRGTEFSVNLTKDAVTVGYTGDNCQTFPFTHKHFHVASYGCNKLCLYSCGAGNAEDDLTCFTRTPSTVNQNFLNEAVQNLPLIQFNRGNFRPIDRTCCSE